MRVGDNISPFWQNVVMVLLILCYGLNFILAISSLWGWHSINWLCTVVLVVIVIEDRKTIKAALTSPASRFSDRCFAWYIVFLALGAIAVNTTLLVI